MCENNRELDKRKENEAMLLDILAEYEQKKDDIHTVGHTSSSFDAFETNGSIYSADEYSTPQELLALVFLGTN